MRNLIAAAAGGLAITACASLPPVTVQYYPTAGSTEVTVLETLACTPDRSEIVAVYALKPETRYFRAPDRAPHQVRLRGVIPPWSDGVAGFAFYDDGRLKSLNSTATGRGEEVVNAGVGLISSAVGAGLFGPGLASEHSLMGDPGLPGRPLISNPCDRIVGADGKGVLTIEHTATVSHARLGAGQVPLRLSPRNAAIRAHFSDALPALRLDVSAPQRIAPTTLYTADRTSPDVVLLPLNHTAAAELSLTTIGEPDQRMRITSPIIIAEADTYEVPLPRAAPFGERSVSLGLAESGAITALSYGTKSGIAGAANGGATLVGLFGEDSAAVQAAEVKGEADLIAQLQRLARCRADPTACI